MFKLAILCIALANCALISATSNSKDGSKFTASASASEHVGSGHTNGGSSQQFVPHFVQDIETYQRALYEYLNDAKDYHTRAYTTTYASPNSQAFATSSLVSNGDDYNNQRIIAQNQAYLHNLQRQAAAQHEAIQNEIDYQLRQTMRMGHNSIPVAMPFYSGGSAGYGYHGGHQTSFVVPQSYAEPDVDTRFDGSDSGSNYGGNQFDGGNFGGSDNFDGGNFGGDDNFAGGDFSIPEIHIPEPPKMPKIPIGPNLSGFGANGKNYASATGKGGSNYAVSSSSFSSSSDVNGKKKHAGGSQTVINDNGKVHTFETRH